MGVDSNPFASNLSSVILALAGFENHEDELYHWYFEKLEHYTELNNASDNNDVLFEFYATIIARKNQHMATSPD